MKPDGILLSNTGSPSAPTTQAVRRYLAQFLMDPHIIDLPHWKRWLLVHGIILRTRIRRSLNHYQAVWTPEGSPLIVISRRQREALRSKLGIPVEWGFRYGQPSIEEGLQKLIQQNCRTIKVFPLFPQYSWATTQTIWDELDNALGKITHPPQIQRVQPFWNHPAYLDAWIESIRKGLPPEMEHLLFSFHGLPETAVRHADRSGGSCLSREDCCLRASGEHLDHCYRAQCLRMARSAAEELTLPPNKFSVCYQSRLGHGAWLAPSTHETVIALAEKGIKHLAIVAPSFITDCLETLYEIKIQLRQTFLEHGGRELTLIPCLNEQTEWMLSILKD